MIDFHIAEQAKIYSKEDKENIMNLMRKIVGYAAFVKKMGVMAIEHDGGEITPIALEFAIQLICDLTEAKIVDDILSTHIYYSGLHGRELLELCIIRQGILGIQSDLSLREIELQLTAYTGEYNIVDNNVFGDHDRFYSFIKELKVNSFKGEDLELDKMIISVDAQYLKTFFKDQSLNYKSWLLLSISSESLIKIFNSLEINKAVELKAYYCNRKYFISYYKQLIADSKLLLKNYLMKIKGVI